MNEATRIYDDTTDSWKAFSRKRPLPCKFLNPLFPSNTSSFSMLFARSVRRIALRMNPELLRLLHEALEKHREHKSRNELIETLILKYLETKGKLSSSFIAEYHRQHHRYQELQLLRTYVRNRLLAQMLHCQKTSGNHLSWLDIYSNTMPALPAELCLTLSLHTALRVNIYLVTICTPSPLLNLLYLRQSK